MMDETQILDVAKQLISHYGPQKTTMKDIAERLSISTPYLLKFFEDKGVLILTIIRSINQDLYDEIGRKLVRRISLPEILETVLKLKMAQFKTYFRVVHSLSYLERIGDLELLRQEFQDNNRKIAVLITERTNNANSAESSIFTLLIFDLLQKADQLAEGYIIEYLPNGTVGNISFKRLYQEMLELQNSFLNKDIGTNQKS